MFSLSTTSHNTSGDEHGIPEVHRACRWCGIAPAQKSQHFCSDACRFWSKVQKGPSCWLWTGALFTNRRKKPGQLYGQFTVWRGGVQVHIGAHVFSYELANGPKPDSLHCLHTCDCPPCVRPDHLYAGTHKNNMEDAAARGRLHTPRPTRHQITAEQIYELRSLRGQGWSGVSLATRYGITEGFVSLIVRGKRRQYDTPLRPALEQVG